MDLLQLSPTRLQFLLRLPTLINSSLDSKQVLSVALKHLKQELHAEAATVFLRSGSGKELLFWAFQGGSVELEGKRMSVDKGIAGWVFKNGKPVVSDDVTEDPRFFSAIDREGGFQTKSMICVPLIIRGDRTLGAIQVLNEQRAGKFTDEDLIFLEQFAHQAAIALENARLYEELKQRMQELAVLDRRKQEMLSVLSHELRTPVNVIQSSAEMLIEEAVSAEDKAAMYRTLENGVQRLVGLAGRLKTASATLNEDLEIYATEVELSELFEELKEYHAESEKERTLQASFHIEPGAERVLADSTLLSIVCRNLLSNAIRFTPDGGMILLRAKSLDGLVEISVEDSGVGIAEEDFSLIFEKFFELSDAAHHSSGTFGFQSGGLGLGLAAVKSIVESHGSEIQVTSRLGKGSVFRFSLPNGARK